MARRGPRKKANASSPGTPVRGVIRFKTLPEQAAAALASPATAATVLTHSVAVGSHLLGASGKKNLLQQFLDWLALKTKDTAIGPFIQGVDDYVNANVNKVIGIMAVVLALHLTAGRYALEYSLGFALVFALLPDLGTQWYYFIAFAAIAYHSAANNRTRVFVLVSITLIALAMLPETGLVTRLTSKTGANDTH